MNPKLFEERLEPLGYFRRQLKGNSPLSPDAYEDLIFVPVNQRPICPACQQGHYMTFQRKHLHRDPYWHVKCWTCRDSWHEKQLKITE